MVELQFVVLAVAGSSPVGRPSQLSVHQALNDLRVFVLCVALAFSLAVGLEAGSTNYAHSKLQIPIAETMDQEADEQCGVDHGGEDDGG